VLTQEERARQRLAVTIANQNLEGRDTIDLLSLTDRYHIGIDLKKALDKPGSKADVILRAGDIVDIPQMNNTVKISGAVFYPNTVNYDKNNSWRDYVREAGGYTHNARKHKTYAIYQNGKVATVRGNRIRTEPGMEIVVPEKAEREREALSATDIASLVTSTSSIAYLIYAVTMMMSR
jgi:protein involved in polysaccharide export with SLBB domain